MRDTRKRQFLLAAQVEGYAGAGELWGARSRVIISNERYATVFLLTGQQMKNNSIMPIDY